MIKMAEDKPKVIGFPLERLGETFGNKKGKVTTTRKTRDRGETWTPTSIKRQRPSRRKTTPSKKKDTADFELFMHIIGTNFQDKKYIENFVGLPLENISQVHNEWFTRGRNDIAVSHVDQHLTTEQYERALNWIQGVLLMKATANPSDSLGKKILKHLRLR